MSKRVLAMALAILAFFIFVGSPFGQDANAIVGVSSGIIAIIIAALAALGITFVTNGAFDTLNEYVGDLMQQYATVSNTTIYEQMKGVQTGSNKLGQIIVNNRFVVYIQGFAAWLTYKLGLTNNDNVDLVRPGASINDLTVYTLPMVVVPAAYEGWEVYIASSTAATVAVFIDDSQGISALNIYFAGTSNFTITRNAYNSKGQLSSTATYNSQPYGNTGWHIFSNGVGFRFPRDANYDYYTGDEFYDALNESSGISVGNNRIQVKTDVISLPYDDSDYTDGDGAVIDVNADWGDTYPDVTEEVIPGDFSDSKEGEATIEYVGEEEAASQVDDTPAQSISQEVSDYQTPGLQGVFPFCIPFDIYAFFECLAADPVAPSFTWRFYIPGICDEDIEIDLAAFDSAARILRTMELLLFIVGLAFVTRDKFLRG